MTHPLTTSAAVLFAAALSAGPAAFAQLPYAPVEPSIATPEVVFRVDIKTVTERGPDAGTSPLAPRLFLDAAHQTQAPLGTAVWFVADLAGDGLPFLAQGTHDIPLGQILGADDEVLFRDVVDGDQPGNRPGSYRRLGLPITWEPDDAARIKNAPLFMILWNATGEDYQPAPGATFGLYEVGVRPPPDTGLGNAFWSIQRDVSAADYDVVPEPAAWTAAGAGLALLIVRLLRRRDVVH